MSLRSYVILCIIALLAIVSISIVWQLLTANYPTHSDVFFMGVEAGVLAVVLLSLLVFNGLFHISLSGVPRAHFISKMPTEGKRLKARLQ